MSRSSDAWSSIPLASLAAALPAVAPLTPPSAQAAQSLSIEPAQKTAFPEADRFEARVLRPTPEQQRALDALAPVRQRGEVRQIEAWAGTQRLGTLYVDDVIGKVEWITYALALGPDGSVRNLEILEYRETHGFEVRTPSWRKQFAGHKADAPLHFGEDIKNISGATLSCSHLTAGVQRLLWLHTQGNRIPR